ncbi:6233_t:CDS:2 [Cetraspora pellucida]|uniref:6233_t:CDS:1 n=1 Tax=Cetraspora pellucida TaxID=1433469 RepID=A0A9N9P4S6_9GLOM|nr:6233_t:CDS:2 [Cetraspora pellucida]
MSTNFTKILDELKFEHKKNCVEIQDFEKMQNKKSEYEKNNKHNYEVLSLYQTENSMLSNENKELQQKIDNYKNKIKKLKENEYIKIDQFEYENNYFKQNNKELLSLMLFISNFINIEHYLNLYNRYEIYDNYYNEMNNQNNINEENENNIKNDNKFNEFIHYNN